MTTEDNMQKWEYRTIKQARGFGAPIAGAQPTPWTPEVNLNKIGSEGWELVNAFTVSSIQGEGWSGITSEVVWVFKRPAIE
jgi:hypothetical protein